MERSIQGVRMVTESVEGGTQGPLRQSVFLFAGDRSRPGIETPAKSAYDIQRLDLRKTVRVFVKQRRYQEIPVFDLLTEEERNAFVKSGRHWTARYAARQRPASGEIRMVVEYEKTAQRETMFGCDAYKWLIVQRQERRQGEAVSSTESRSEAWYLDVEESTRKYPGFSPRLIRHGFCFMTVNGEVPVLERRGEVPRGLCVQSTTTTTNRMELATGEVREQVDIRGLKTLLLSEERFSESIFEPPRGFRKMPVYPSRLSMARLDAARNLKLLAWRMGSAMFRGKVD
jgi:hypothetical protein